MLFKSRTTGQVTDLPEPYGWLFPDLEPTDEDPTPCASCGIFESEEKTDQPEGESLPAVAPARRGPGKHSGSYVPDTTPKEG